MSIGHIDNLKCDLCKLKVEGGFDLQEVDEDTWIVVCVPCLHVTEIAEGK